jgi:catechol 2,3-dioxygenase-like lactoylglutathione lyase family enzyme
MLKNAEIIATVAVKDIDAARHFYAEVLGLELIPQPMGEVMQFRSGSTKLIVYRSQLAGTNQATAANFAVDDVDSEVAALAARGVRFEHYDIPDVKHVGDVHVFGDFHTAWFKDPDGNILSIVPRR